MYFLWPLLFPFCEFLRSPITSVPRTMSRQIARHRLATISPLSLMRVRKLPFENVDHFEVDQTLGRAEAGQEQAAGSKPVC